MAREIPQYISQLSIGSKPQVQYSNANADLLRGASAEMQVMAEDINKKNSRIVELETKTSLRENLHRIYNENRTNPAAVKENSQAFIKSFVSKISDPMLAAEVDSSARMEVMPYIDRAGAEYDNILNEKNKLAMLTALSRNSANLSTISSNVLSEVPENRANAFSAMEKLMEEQAQIASATDNYGRPLFSAEKQESIRLDSMRALLDGVPPEKRIELFGGAKGGWSEAQAIIRKHEGVFNPKDGNTNEPALFGINRKHHKEAFEAVNAIYKSKGTAAGQAAADEYLKKTFWDANDLDSLDPRVQGIVYDGLINGAPKGFLKEAKAGASPATLLQMRQDYYDILASKKDKDGKFIHSRDDVVSWNKRLASFSHLAVSDKLDGIDEGTKRKAIAEAVAQFKAQEEMASINRVMELASKDKGIYTMFVNNSPDILQNIEDYRNNGGDAELADYMRKSALTRNKIPPAEEDIIFSGLFDEVQGLNITYDTKRDKVRIGKSDTSLEDVVRLQNKIIKAGVNGVSHTDSLLNKLSPAIRYLADKERGTDDKGLDSLFGFFRNTEAYDAGYNKINTYLKQQDKEDDAALRAFLLRDFISKADQIPEDIAKNPELFELEQTKISNSVIAAHASRGLKNIPLVSINKLIANPSLAPAFDEKFGAGAAKKVLGNS